MNIPMIALRWIIAAIITMIAVGAVTPGNKDNTLPRALGVTAVVALLVTPFMWMWFLLIPALVGVIGWFLVYRLAYGVKTGQAIAVGLVQVVVSFLIDWLLIGARLG